MAAITGKNEPTGLDELSVANAEVVRAKLRGIGSPAQAHPEMAAVVWMFGLALVMLACAVIACGPALWVAVGGGA